ncbi:hypothetical protein GCM10011506_24400 [Marivirga lumbricoides]|uniref:histidine kinase n=1 Tax=Marivirga lumbricoides TaxID=1046115 RepID=A0ABQ1MF20_9BACT|nr:hypothetical protein GCM10011506_24400 [Marivirga lumbricoides]
MDTLYRKAKEFYEEGNYTSALPIYLKIDSLAGKNNILNKTVIKSILDRSEISRTTFTHAGVEAAKELQLEALALAEVLGSAALINDVYMRLADMYGLIGEYDTTKIYLDKAFEYYKTTDDTKKLCRLYLIYMNYYFAIDKLDSAGFYLQEGVEYISKKEAPQELATLLIYHGNYFEKYKSDFPNALIRFKKAKRIYEGIEDTLTHEFSRLHEGLAYTYKGLGDHEKAFQHYAKFYTIRDGMRKKANNELTRTLETKYQTDKKAKEIQLLKAQTALAEKERKTQLFVLIAAIFLILIIAVFYFILSRNRKRTNKKLRELDQLKSNFFANISHEFRTPLTLIKGSAQIELNNPGLDDHLKKHLSIIDQNSERVLELVDQLLDLSKLEAHKMDLKVKPIMLKQWISLQVEPYIYLANQKKQEFKINFETSSESEEVVLIDPEVLSKAVTNLFSNAVKYGNEHGKIDLKVACQEGTLLISVKNTGEIITPEHQEKIFNRFYQVNAEKNGVGIGLALVKELVELHKGNIYFEATEKFNHFKIEIPVKRDSYSALELEASAGKGTIEVSLPQVNGSSKTADVTRELWNSNGQIRTSGDNPEEELPIMLVVDDNADIRFLISEQFQRNFIILEAENGSEGIEKAFDVIPDIIISDVMMPVMNGISLCNTLKKDEKTSHIPIILLTAKAGEENELCGLETGADDYILKPFNHKLLQTRVEKLIEIRKKLRERYSQELVLKPMDIAIAPADEVFLDKVQSLMDNKLSAPDFTAEMFSKEIGMSRMQLHRKLKALTGLSTSEFIRSQRMKLAECLLKTKGITVAEVAYAVGFNDPSYFSKCFKETYGRTPHSYATFNTVSSIN